MEIKVKKPNAVKLTLDDHDLLVAHSVKHGLKRTVESVLIPRTALIGMEMHQPTEDDDGHFQVTYQLDKKSAEQIAEFWFSASDAPFVLELKQILEQQIDKNSEWGEDDFVANGQLIMEYLEMRKKGLLTNEEFEAKKREILRLD
ncbi:SHOCT domain-containing protein [Loigolactobacillus coryniformis]|jgi:hypothetical protein|uniref:Uncharacterized protein n=2 Tax=Loigolactobacillus coryniformis TaxID=1610 RepID=A0A2D1KKS2_9LACO|nr:SHOCT domain-containing protein [Loigolactobacillus coryniformis]MDT3392437.1 SHOCT domain-containing protein [Bacillota bacterium]RRG03465.1 MAG: SHOCT domain-containing protein [Lactobacillus sp.]ATO42662.1 hypothetical protein LC20004_01430 [Loigolactobacillus coryniformis subsp. torquens DSM 20004 = KCTC 3535]KRK85567.1 hypothetical protein FC16_GL000979 [Loigolactobacillus coryniformis subsp. torquens DSM 20004 = KCTC 3535]MBW4801422.1 SHOCT domain-containing protein [Loigolactobacillu